MAIKVSTTTVIDNDRNVVNVGSVGDSNTVYYGDGSNLSGAGSGNEFVASGAIDNGDTVVINTDGTVSVVSEGDPTFGPLTNFSDAETSYVKAIYDTSNNKVVIVYSDLDNSNYGTAVVGTVSGTSISFGTPVAFESVYTSQISPIYDSANGKVVIAYRDQSTSTQYGKAVVGTVSGTSISFGTPVVFATANSVSEISAIYDTSNNKVVIAYEVSFDGKAIVGTVSGTSISFGSVATFTLEDVRYVSTIYDSANNKVVIAYVDDGSSGTERGTAVVGTVSGTSISFGTPVVFESDNNVDPGLDTISTTFDSNSNKVVIAYKTPINFFSAPGKAIVGTVSGTSISFGSAVTYEANNPGANSLTFDSSTNKVVVSYAVNPIFGSSSTQLKVGTVSGNSISFGSAVTIISNIIDEISSTYDSTNQKVVIAYADDKNTGTDEGISVVCDTTGLNLTEDNYIGIAAEAISDGATGEITTLNKVNSSQTGLTSARTYYVQRDGSLALTADDPSVVAGTSISSTQILVR